VPELPSITRGQTVTVLGDCLPKQGVKVVLRTGKEKQGDKGLSPLDAKVADDRKSLSFQIPQGSFETGRYLVFITVDSKDCQSRETFECFRMTRRRSQSILSHQ
jgi:hypothetical protein